MSACPDGRFALVVSERMLWQLVEALMEEPLNLSLNASMQLMAGVKEVAQLVPGHDALEAARNGRADYLITYRRNRYAPRAQREAGNRRRADDVWIRSVWDAGVELEMA